MKKYEIISSFKPAGDYRTYHEIRALADIPMHRVKAGDLGGVIESESNLAHEGACWVAYGASITGRAQVLDNALVRGSSQVSGTAKIGGNAIVKGYTRIFGEGELFVCGNAVISNAGVYGEAKIFENAFVAGNVEGRAMISGYAHVSRHAWVYGDARISGRAKILDRAQISGSAIIFGNSVVRGDCGGFERGHFVFFNNKWYWRVNYEYRLEKNTFVPLESPTSGYWEMAEISSVRDGTIFDNIYCRDIRWEDLTSPAQTLNEPAC